MSNLPTPSAQISIKVQAPMDAIQFRDNKGQAIAWITCTGAAHFLGDNSGVLPTATATKIFGFATVGSFPGSVLALLDRNGNAQGWIDQNGVPRGSLASWAGRSTGFIDSSGTPQGSGPLGIGSL